MEILILVLGLFLAYIGIIAILYLPLHIYLRLLQKKSDAFAIGFLVLSIPVYIGISYFAAVYNLSWLCPLYPILVFPLALIKLFRTQVALQAKNPQESKRRLWFWLGGLSILIFQFLPAISASALPGYCINLEKEQTADLVSTIHAFSEANGHLPQSMEQLALESPNPSCSSLPGQSDRHFSLSSNSDFHFIIVQSVNKYSCEIYNIEKNQWFLVDRFEIPCE